MRVIILIAAVALILIPFTLKAWNGEKVPIPGVNQIVDSVLDSVRGEGTADSTESTLPENSPEELEEDNDLVLQVIEIQKTALKQFQSSDGKYYRASTPEEYEKFAKSLTPFYGGRGVLAVKADLAAAAGVKTLPLFFSVSIDTETRLIGGEEGIQQPVATATVKAAYSREEVNPLPSKVPIRSVIGPEPYGTGFLSRFNDLEDFIVKVVDGGKEDGRINPATWMNIQGKVLADLEYFGIKAIPSTLVAEVRWSYAEGTEQHTQSLRFLPYRTERQFGVQSQYKTAREGFATATGLDPARLEQKIKALVNKDKRVEKVWVIYQPHNDSLVVEIRQGATTVQVTLLTNEQLLWEFEQAGGYLNPGAKPRDLRTKILDDLGYYQVITKPDGSTHRSYEGYQLPSSFVRKVRHSKSGQENPIVSYRFRKELLPAGALIKSREEVDLFIENIMDRGDLEGVPHYYYGCLQTRKEIVDLFNAYAATQEKPFPCAAGYNHHTRMVEVFKKVEVSDTAETQPTTTSESVSGNVYKVSDLSKIDDLKKQIAKEHGEGVANTMAKAGEYKASVEKAIKEGKTSITLKKGNEIVGGYLKFFVLEGAVQYGIVQFGKK